MQIIAITGGSGTGKSTISYRLVDTYSKILEVLNLDDYHKLKTDPNLPKLHGMVNWDHPDIFRWEDLFTDIETLRKGSSLTIQSWAHRSNLDYFNHGKMIPRTIYPKEVLIIEGYFALWNEKLRKFYKRSYYLDLDIEKSLKRRKKFKNSEYDIKVLIPMHKKYIEPTKKYADVVINVENLEESEVYKKVEEDLKRIIKIT